MLRRIFIALCLMPTMALAQNTADFKRYEQAKLALVYEGDVGNLLQQLAHRLEVGYLSYKLDPTIKIKIESSETIVIKSVLEKIENQVPNLELRFNKVGDFVFMTAQDRRFPLELKNKQYIGELILEDDKEKRQAEQLNEQPLIITQYKEDTPEAKALNEIVDRTTDETVIAKYKKKKSPQYKLSKKEFDGLETVKVTPIGTFLVFEKNVNTALFKVKGNFEKLAQYGNLIAISHEKVIAPKRIEIEFDGKVMLLTKSGK